MDEIALPDSSSFHLDLLMTIAPRTSRKNFVQLTSKQASRRRKVYLSREFSFLECASSERKLEMMMVFKEKRQQKCCKCSVGSFAFIFLGVRHLSKQPSN